MANLRLKIRTALLSQRLIMALVFKKLALLPWRRGVVVIVSSNRTEDRGFKSRQGFKVVGLYTL
jgi:hypothetical protein